MTTKKYGQFCPKYIIFYKKDVDHAASVEGNFSQLTSLRPLANFTH